MSSTLPPADEFRRDLRKVVRDELGPSGDRRRHVLVHAWSSNINNEHSLAAWIRRNFRANGLNAYAFSDLGDLYDKYNVRNIDVAQKVGQTSNVILLFCTEEDYKSGASKITDRIVRDFTSTGPGRAPLQNRLKYYVERGIGGLPQASPNDSVSGFQPSSLEDVTPDRPPTFRTRHELLKSAGSKIAAQLRQSSMSTSTPGVEFDSK